MSQLGQYCLRQWLITWQHPAITWINVDLTWGTVKRQRKYPRYQSLKSDRNFKTNTTCPKGQWVNSLWPCDTIWWHRSGSTLAQVMTCYLMALSHYLNQCWLIILWQTLTPISQEVIMNLIHNMCSKITPRKLLPYLPRINELTKVHRLPIPHFTWITCGSNISK